MNIHSTCTAASAALFVMMVGAGCATDDLDRQAKAGAVIGAVTGAVIGHLVDDKRGRFTGAAIGAIEGAFVGSYQDKQQWRLESALAEEQRQELIEIRRLEDESLAVGLSSDACFAFDSSEIRPALYRALDNIAATVVDYDQTVLHIVGHTDSIGDADYNEAQSIWRAQAVA